jgi:hypothetical protein
MCNKLITALLIAISTGAASAQVAGASGSHTNALTSSSAPAQGTGSSGGMTNAFQPSPAINQKGAIGVGPMLGEPMGATAKMWLSDTLAVDGGLGWSFVDPDGCQLHGDVLFHKFDLLRADTRDLPVYIGVGGRVKFAEHGDNLAGIRVPLGVAYLMPQQRLEFYAEVAPILDVAPTTTVNWNGGIGIRYYFK